MAPGGGRSSGAHDWLPRRLRHGPGRPSPMPPAAPASHLEQRVLHPDLLLLLSHAAGVALGGVQLCAPGVRRMALLLGDVAKSAASSEVGTPDTRQLDGKQAAQRWPRGGAKPAAPSRGRHAPSCTRRSSVRVRLVLAMFSLLQQGRWVGWAMRHAATSHTHAA